MRDGLSLLFPSSGSLLSICWLEAHLARLVLILCRQYTGYDQYETLPALFEEDYYRIPELANAPEFSYEVQQNFECFETLSELDEIRSYMQNIERQLKNMNDHTNLILRILRETPRLPLESTEPLPRKPPNTRHSFRWGPCAWPKCSRGKMKCADFCYDHQGSDARLRAYTRAAEERCKWTTPTTACREKHALGDSYCITHRSLINRRAQKGGK